MRIDPRYGKLGVELTSVSVGSLIDYHTDNPRWPGTYSVVWDPQMTWAVEMLRSEQLFPAIVLEHCVGNLVHVVTKSGQTGYLNCRSTVQVIAG